ncbi:uncharacterized protein [Elaeis guineensis]|uniref:Uncharacterized protein LOC105048138 n=1 Tax=Elaeis guineensis var. tenera TaxID=51953 RepID=A0A6I9RG13_ELAGV|nr:uncharacterized protein LOC105048138 [Elaeis guineensis]
MEEDGGSPILMVSPSFREAVAEDGGDRLAAAVESPQKISAAPEHHYEVEDDDDDTSEDFEFAFVIKDPDSGTAITADEIFSNGQIRPVYPVFNRDLLLAGGGGGGGSGESVEVKTVRLPLRTLLIEERNASSGLASSSSSSEMEELDEIPPGTYCVWTPGSVPPSPARCKKSSSTGSSLRWRIRDLVRRSRSDGKEKFVFLAAEEKNPGRSSEKKKKGKAEEAAVAAAAAEDEEREMKGKERRGGKKEVKATKVDMVTAHRIYYGSRSGGGQTAKGGRRSFLPYKPALVGFFANVNGLSRTHHPY